MKQESEDFTVRFPAFLYILLFVQVFLRGGQHQLDTVKLVDLAGTGIIVDCYDICLRVLVADLFDDALTYDMVRQAGKRLGTYDVFRATVDQLHHLSGQKPSFTGLVSD